MAKILGINGYDVSLEEALTVAAVYAATGGIGAAAVGGGMIMGKMSARGAQNAQIEAQNAAQKKAVQNENALVKQQFGKRSMQGLGDGWGLQSPSGNAASQTGAVLTSTQEKSTPNILG